MLFLHKKGKVPQAFWPGLWSYKSCGFLKVTFYLEQKDFEYRVEGLCVAKELTEKRFPSSAMQTGN